ncbi:lmf2 [Scenedesmus sp. PABB004]|nr:lmf2 [Scenedesmus sp. PABB004]
MRPPASTAAVLLLATTSLLLAAGGAAGADLCLLKLSVSAQQSPWAGGGSMTVPTEAFITSSKINATGNVYLAVPTNASCPPELTAANAASVLERSALALPVGDDGVAFKPSDIRSNITADPTDKTAPPLAVFDFYDLGFGLTGNEPLGPGAVTVGAGTAAEARAAAQPLCAQVVLLGGALNLTSVLGPRTADVKHVAYNRTMAAGISVKKSGAELGGLTLVVVNATIFLNVSPETVPGVQMSRAKYLLSGDLVATADLSDIDSWEAVPAAEADWAAVPRLDAPVVIAPDEPGPRAKARVLGVNSTLPQECRPSRVVGAGGALADTPSDAPAGQTGAAKSGAAGGRGAAAAGAALAAAAAAVAALLALAMERGIAIRAALVAVGALHAAAFVALLLQLPALFGPRGLQPVSAYLRMAAEMLPGDGAPGRAWALLRSHPTLLWLHPALGLSAEGMLAGLCVAGAAAGAAVAAGCLSPLLFATLWAALLSAVGVGQAFLPQPGDALLLEVTFACIWVALGLRGSDSEAAPEQAAHPAAHPAALLLRWLLFKLLLASSSAKAAVACGGAQSLAECSAVLAAQGQPHMFTSLAQALAPYLGPPAAALALLELPAAFLLLAPLPALQPPLAAGLLALQLLRAALGAGSLWHLAAAVLCVAVLDDGTVARWLPGAAGAAAGDGAAPGAGSAELLSFKAGGLHKRSASMDSLASLLSEPEQAVSGPGQQQRAGLLGSAGVRAAGAVAAAVAGVALGYSPAAWLSLAPLLRVAAPCAAAWWLVRLALAAKQHVQAALVASAAAVAKLAEQAAAARRAAQAAAAGAGAARGTPANGVAHPSPSPAKPPASAAADTPAAEAAAEAAEGGDAGKASASRRRTAAKAASSGPATPRRGRGKAAAAADGADDAGDHAEPAAGAAGKAKRAPARGRRTSSAAAEPAAVDGAIAGGDGATPPRATAAAARAAAPQTPPTPTPGVPAAGAAAPAGPGLVALLRPRLQVLAALLAAAAVLGVFAAGLPAVLVPAGYSQATLGSVPGLLPAYRAARNLGAVSGAAGVHGAWQAAAVAAASGQAGSHLVFELATSADGAAWSPVRFRSGLSGGAAAGPLALARGLHEPRLAGRLAAAGAGRLSDNMWLLPLANMVLEGAPELGPLLADAPAPRGWVRVDLVRYTPAPGAPGGWDVAHVSEVLPVIPRGDPDLKDTLAALGARGGAGGGGWGAWDVVAALPHAPTIAAVLLAGGLLLRRAAGGGA